MMKTKQVLSDAAILGLLDGYNYPTNTAAPRQWVAVMFKNALLNALTYDTITPVVFNGLLTGNTLPTSNYKTMGEKYFDLVEFEGVITANEWADLYGTSALDAGETQIGDKVYNLPTTLDDIGENRWGYAVGSDVMYIEDAGNTTWDNDGAAVTVKASKVGMDSLKDAEYFTNFGAKVEGYYVSDYKITYVIKEIQDTFSGADNATGKKAAEDAFKAYYGFAPTTATYDAVNKNYVCVYNGDTIEVVLRPDKKIVEIDLNCIKEIFYSADRTADDNGKETIVKGEVYVGTQSLKDISDEISYRAFYNTYIDDQATYTDAFDEAKNGQWLKVIDNDDDGVAEYVFLVDTDMVEVTSISKKASRITFTKYGQVKLADVVTEDELAVGDVVLVTKIDGIYYVDLAEIENNEIDKRGLDFKNETITCGETTYEWSGIEEDTSLAFDYIDELYNAEEYDFYLDRFGYVRAAEYPAYSRGFVLLTDGYFETDKRDELWKAEIYDTEADALEDVVVLNSSSYYDEESFIDDSTFSGDKEWERLIEFGSMYNMVTGKYDADSSEYLTNLAAYAVNDDGEYALYEVNNAGSKDVYDIVALDNLVKTNGKAISVASEELHSAAVGDIHTTTKTQYYLVTKNVYGIKSVIDWVGYSNAPEGTTLNPTDLRAYAIIEQGDVASYDVAHVVVFETKAAVSDDLGLVFALDQIRNNPTVNSYRGFDAYWLAYDAENEVYSYNLSAEVDPTETVEIDEISELVQYAIIDSIGNLIVVDEGFAGYNIYAGVARTAADVNDYDYVYVDVAGGGEKSFKPASVQNFIVVEDSSKASVRTRYDVVDNEEGYYAGDLLIFMTNDSGKIKYVINASESYDAEEYTSWNKATYGVAALADIVNETGLYYDIVEDATKAPVDTAYDLAVAAYAAMTGTETSAQIQAVIDLVDDALAVDADNVTLKAMKNDLVAKKAAVDGNDSAKAAAIANVKGEISEFRGNDGVDDADIAAIEALLLPELEGMTTAELTTIAGLNDLGSQAFYQKHVAEIAKILAAADHEDAMKKAVDNVKAEIAEIKTQYMDAEDVAAIEALLLPALEDMTTAELDAVAGLHDLGGQAWYQANLAAIAKIRDDAEAAYLLAELKADVEAKLDAMTVVEPTAGDYHSVKGAIAYQAWYDLQSVKTTLTCEVIDMGDSFTAMNSGDMDTFNVTVTIWDTSTSTAVTTAYPLVVKVIIQ